MKRPIEISLVIAVAATAGYFFHGMMPETSATTQSTQVAKLPALAANEIAFAAGAPQLSAIKVESANLAPLPISEPLNARLTYDDEVTAKISSPIAGRITKLNVAAGDAVASGSALIAIDAPDLAAAVADTRKAQADELRKRLTVERSDKLFAAEVIPRKDLEVAQADFVQAQAETLRAQLRLKNLSPNGAASSGSLIIKAPLAGTVVERKANPAMEVQPGMADPLLIVSDLTRLWAVIDLPERYVGQVKEGLIINFTVDAFPGEIFDGRVSRIGQTVNPDTRRVQVRCDVSNAARKLKPEMYAKVTLLAQGDYPAVRLPNSALITDGLYSFIYVETRPQVFEKRKVTLSVQDREFSYVKQGVSKDEKVVTVGALLLQSEQAITPYSPNATNASNTSNAPK